MRHKRGNGGPIFNFGAGAHREGPILCFYFRVVGSLKGGVANNPGAHIPIGGLAGQRRIIFSRGGH